MKDLLCLLANLLDYLSYKAKAHEDKNMIISSSARANQKNPLMVWFSKFIGPPLRLLLCFFFLFPFFVFFFFQ